MFFPKKKGHSKKQFQVKSFHAVNGVYFPERNQKVLAIRNGSVVLSFLQLNLSLLLRFILRNRLSKTALEKIKTPSLAVSLAVAVLLLAGSVFFAILKSHASVSTYTAQWSTQADFENNASTVSTATTKTNVNTSGIPGSVKLSTASASITQTDDGTTNTGFNEAGYNHNQTTLTGTGSGASVQLGVSGTGGSFKVVTGGSYSQCGLKSDGTVYCWGRNSQGQLGDGTSGTGRLTPVQVLKGASSSTNNYLQGITAIAMNDQAAGPYTCAIKGSDGSVWCWGSNYLGRLGDGTTTNSSTPVRAGTLTGVSALSMDSYAATDGSTCALKNDGTVWCWGRNYNGQLGDGTTTNSSTPVQVTGVGGSGTLINVSAIATGSVGSLVGSYACALKSDGTVYCWGNNAAGQLGDNTTTQRNAPVQVLGVGGSGTLTGITAISLGHNVGRTCALKSDGTVYCWGSNAAGQLGDNTTTQRNAPAQVCAPGTTVADGTCGGAGHYLTGVSAIAAQGIYFVCALKSDGTVYCWGRNADGQLGDNTTTQRNAPVQVLGVGGSSYLILSSTTYYSSGTFTSGSIDLTASNAFGALSWTLSGSYPGATLKVRTSANADMSGAPAWSACSDIANDSSITGGGCATIGHRYLQYQAVLTTSNNTYTTFLDSVTINYSGAYASSGTITKFLVDAGAQASFTNINWNGTNTSNTATKFRTRGITDAQCTSYGSCANAWTALSPTLQWSNCDGASGLNTGLCSGGYYAVSNAYITANNASSTYPTYRYLEIELTLTTSNGGESPQLNDFTIGYKLNAPPTVAHTITPVQGSDGLVHLTYSISDSDTAEAINQPGYTDVSFQYWDGSTWQTASTFLKPDKAALQYCKHASEHNLKNSGKPWKYLLIPHSEVLPNMSLGYLAGKREFTG